MYSKILSSVTVIFVLFIYSSATEAQTPTLGLSIGDKVEKVDEVIKTLKSSGKLKEALTVFEMNKEKPYKSYDFNYAYQLVIGDKVLEPTISFVTGNEFFGRLEQIKLNFIKRDTFIVSNELRKSDIIRDYPRMVEIKNQPDTGKKEIITHKGLNRHEMEILTGYLGDLYGEPDSQYLNTQRSTLYGEEKINTILWKKRGFSIKLEYLEDDTEELFRPILLYESISMN